ncbi:hypothetical protein AMR42_18965 [Limnothrix sp. PR1529]|nr:hypothetical protein BCR12_13075 [Limnothrix sp. P13C2]PIB03409.1 hypothetical protein AMR42_18965 [Limnothrix sp. PR1529]
METGRNSTAKLPIFGPPGDRGWAIQDMIQSKGIAQEPCSSGLMMQIKLVEHSRQIQQTEAMAHSWASQGGTS